MCVYIYIHTHTQASLLAQSVKNLPEMQKTAYNTGDLGSILGREVPLEKEMATRSNMFAWEIP